MPKFFVKPSDIDDGEIRVVEEAHHLRDVMRVRIGTELVLCDGEGTDYTAVVKALEPDCVLCKVVEKKPSEAEPVRLVTLFQGLPKAEKMELIIQKGTELGMADIVPLATKRSIVSLDDKGKAKKTERWQKIADSAATQSGRGRIPKVWEPISFKQLEAPLAEYDLAIILNENERATGLRETLNAMPECRKIAVFIGPEGGWDPEEIAWLEAHDVKSVTLGKRILRTETAGMAALCAIMYHFGEI